MDYKLFVSILCPFYDRICNAWGDGRICGGCVDEFCVRVRSGKITVTEEIMSSITDKYFRERVIAAVFKKVTGV